MAGNLSTSWIDSLKEHGCVRIRVSDPKRLAAEKTRVTDAGLRLGKQVSSSYHKPWLYVLLGEKIPHRQQARAEKSHAAGRAASMNWPRKTCD